MSDDNCFGDGEAKEMIKIRPCPFCAGINIYPAYANQPATHFYCECLDCGAKGPTIERQAIKRRAIADEYIEDVEAAEKWNRTRIMLKGEIVEIDR